MVNVRRDIRITRGAGETREADEGTDEPDEADEEETPGPTSIEDLIQESEPSRFDRTFLVDKEDAPAATGDSWPVPQPWQGIPRLGFVVNLNYVYDEENEEWVRQRPFESRRSGGTIDDFEDGDLAEYSGDTGSFSVDSSSPTFQGSRSLKTTTNNRSITSFGRLPVYPGRGDTFQFRLFLDGADAGGEMAWVATDVDAGQYEAQASVGKGQFRFVRKDQTGTGTQLDIVPVTPPQGVFMRCEVEFGDPTISVTWTREDTGTQLATLEADNADFDTGGIGWSSTQSTGSSINTIAWDLAEITTAR